MMTSILRTIDGAYKAEFTWCPEPGHRRTYTTNPHASFEGAVDELADVLITHGYMPRRWWQWWRWGENEPPALTAAPPEGDR